MYKNNNVYLAVSQEKSQKMKMRFTLAVALLCPMFLMAQPTITRDWIGTSGDEISVLFTVEVPDAGTVGADRSWDFSTVTPDTIRFDYQYVDADTTPFFDSYPTSNSCQSLSDFGFYQYYEIDDDAWEYLGNAFSSILQIFQDTKTILMFPMNFEDTFSDEFASTLSAFTVIKYGTGNINVTADAYGTVILPQGTFDDVMRLQVIEESVDSTDLGSGIVEKIHTSSVSYVWLSRAHPGPLCTRSVTETYQVALVPPIDPDTLFMDPDSSFQYDPTATTSALPYFTTGAFNLKVTPNPFVNNLDLNFTVDNGQKLNFELQTINGQVVYTKNISAVPGQNNFNINVQWLPTGPYIAILKGADEGSVQQVVKIE